MAVHIELDGAVAPVPLAAASVSVQLPAGARVTGMVDQVGASALAQARATIDKANAALAPLGPVFSIVDAVLAVLTFAQTVPKVLTQPNKVVTAIKDLAKKCGRLLSLVPQLSVPILLLGVIDLLIQTLEAFIAELIAIGVQETRVDAAAQVAVDVPALGPVVVTLRAQIARRRSDLAGALAELGTIVEVVNLLCKIAGLPGVSVSADVAAGTTSDAAASLETVLKALRRLRTGLPGGDDFTPPEGSLPASPPPLPPDAERLLFLLDFSRVDLASFTSGDLATIESATGSAAFQADPGFEFDYTLSSPTFGGRGTITTPGGRVLRSVAPIVPTSSAITIALVAKFSTATTHVLAETSPATGTFDQAAYLIINGGAGGSLQTLYNHPIGSHAVKNATTPMGTSAVRRIIATIDASHVNSGMTMYVDGVDDGGSYVDVAASNGGVEDYVWSLLAAADRSIGAAGEFSMIMAFSGLPSSVASLDEWMRQENNL